MCDNNEWIWIWHGTVWIGLRSCSTELLRDGCRDQCEGKISCTVAASLHPHTPPAHSHIRNPVISARGRAYCIQVCDQRVSVRVCCPPLLSIIHFSPCHPSTPLLIHPHPHPSHLVLISFSLPLPLAPGHMHPSFHPHLWLAQTRPRKAAQFWRGVMQKEYKKRCGTTA